MSIDGSIATSIPSTNSCVIDCSMVPEWSFELQNQPTDDGDTVELFSQTS